MNYTLHQTFLESNCKVAEIGLYNKAMIPNTEEHVQQSSDLKLIESVWSKCQCTKAMFNNRLSTDPSTTIWETDMVIFKVLYF